MKKKRAFPFRRNVQITLSLIFALTAVAGYFCSPAGAQRVKKLPVVCEAPQWMKKSVYSSMSAVWRELQNSRVSHSAAVEALALVGSRLFPGCSVALSESGSVIIKPEKKWHWSVSLSVPESAENLPQPYAAFLRGDISAALPKLQTLVSSIPPEALRWGEDSFQSALSSVMAETLPGWHCSARVHALENTAELEIKIYAQPPVVLAVMPETLSSTIPQLLADKINERTVELLSPLTGLPIEWVVFHKQQITDWLGEKQLESRWLKTLRSSAKNEIDLKPISHVTTRIESTTFSLRAWVSGHVGSDARLEAGIHFGRYFSIDTMPSEAYAEAILGLEHWHVDGRFGLRFSPLDYLWVGVEGSTEESSILWYRLWIGDSSRGAYGWLRYSRDSDLEAAVGYHLNRYISLEIYYDDREDDKVSLRAIGNL